MLQLTTDAAELIRELRTERATDDALLRISPRSNFDGAGLVLGFVPAPETDDQVGESEGVPMCIASDLADALADKVLDVTEEPNGRSLILRAA
jgi:Fe-S cluster assembly iron-binding protein IscA